MVVSPNPNLNPCLLIVNNLWPKLDGRSRERFAAGVRVSIRVRIMIRVRVKVGVRVRSGVRGSFRGGVDLGSVSQLGLGLGL
jgi:hypothetical protein